MKLIADAEEGLKVADQKGRILLGSKYAGRRFIVREEADGTAILTPVLVIPEKERPLTHHSSFGHFQWAKWNYC